MNENKKLLDENKEVIRDLKEKMLKWFQNNHILDIQNEIRYSLMNCTHTTVEYNENGDPIVQK